MVPLAHGKGQGMVKFPESVEKAKTRGQDAEGVKTPEKEGGKRAKGGKGGKGGREMERNDVMQETDY